MDQNQEKEDYFKSLNVTITLFPTKSIKTFKTFESFFNFLKKEKVFWEDCVNGSTCNIKQHFQGIFDNINNFNNQQLNYGLQYLSSAINMVNMQEFPNIYSSTPVGKMIRQAYDKNYFRANAIIDCISHRSYNNLNNPEYFEGLLGYMYTNNVLPSEIAIDGQQAALEDLHSRFVTEIDDVYAKYLSNKEEANQTVNLLKGDINSFKNDIILWKDKADNNLISIIDERKKALDKLEQQYKENLKLKAPAEYWNILHNEYKRSGDHWKNWALGVSSFFVILLLIILYKLPDDLAKDVKSLSLETIRATIILALIVSVCIYIIRLFVKLSLSDYHLATDAKERHQLTLVYLSLIDEKGVTNDERTIILQSLFSRADTGLLKGDSSPTIPDGIISQVLKNIGK